MPYRAVAMAGRLIELGSVKLLVSTAGADQLSVRSALHDPAVLDHEDELRSPNGDGHGAHCPNRLVGRSLLARLLDEAGIETVPCTAAHWPVAVDAFARYGKGDIGPP